MAYVHCMAGVVASMTHRLDNIVEGVLTTAEGDVAFATRGHVVKAVNRHYRRSTWKPRVGASVLVDGDLANGRMIVDHIEPEPVPDDAPIASHPHLAAIAAAVAERPAPKDVRVGLAGRVAKIRLCAAASRINARGDVEEELVHGRLDVDTGEWRLASRRRTDGSVSATGIDAAIAIVLARAAGRGLLVGDTVAEAEAAERAAARVSRGGKGPLGTSFKAPSVPAEAPPFDDCPF